MDNLTILIIDDDKVDRKNYIRFLSGSILFKTKIFEADNSKKGMELWKKNQIDCILLDYSLPDINGLEVLKKIKNAETDSPPVIILTGLGNEHIAVEAMKSGATDYITKDEINGHALVTAIANAINQSKLKNQIQLYHKLEAEKKITDEQCRLKNEFLSNMSHELRTPLNPIIAFTQLIYDEKLGKLNKDQKEALDCILTSANHLLNIISNAIEISEFESRKIVLLPKKFKVSQSIEEVINNLRVLAEAKKIQISCKIDKNIANVTLDVTCFKQIVFNYLSNAIKFTPMQGVIQIRVNAEAGEKFRVEVEDSGIGIEAANMEKLFITFQQLDSSIVKEYQGAGLGLSLTKHVAEALGGSVGVTSTPGKGSIFYAVLPRNQVSSRTPSSAVFSE